MARNETIALEQLYKLFHAQTRSCDLWVGQWEKVKDSKNPSLPLFAPHLRNVSLAIGKLMGIFNIVTTILGADEDVPEDVLEKMKHYTAIWDQL